ncbi:Eco57I restriction-modification methylase domain-containing protein [Xanthomonas hortorum pv. vitians]|nr:Eco57I restriction-modification methylase domain-containing protein [Xanthomonas hortorum pv. vitians]
MSTLLSAAESLRISVASKTDRSHKSALGQFMTPAPTAIFMASLLDLSRHNVRLLDAGAGLGALTAAAVDCWLSQRSDRGTLHATAYELDDHLRAHLVEGLKALEARGARVTIKGLDYLQEAAISVRSGERLFTHAILNPPYKKIGVTSDARHSAERAGLTVVNLYAAFVGLALAQIEDGGQLVAIIPRSFCNGPYYKSFRNWILARAAIRQIHLFDSRTLAFQDDKVLQENLIILLEAGKHQSDVTISSSSDDTFSDIKERVVTFATVVKPNDPEVFFHVSMESASGALETAPNITSSLADLGISVSTGPVVSFRTRDHLLSQPQPGSVPMIYPAHFAGFELNWPSTGGKKANAILRNSETERWLYPGPGPYVAVRRMSSKEEKRRVNAAIITADSIGQSDAIGLDNGLNVFHQDKKPLDPDLAWGLLVFLSSNAVDQHFRRFNGHTQVNATDLRNIPYPSRADLVELGRWAQATPGFDERALNSKMDELLEGSTHPMTAITRIQEALSVLQVLDFPRAQLNDRSALCLLALLDLKPNQSWSEAKSPLMGITPIMDWIREHYDKPYAPNTREAFRRQSMHQFLDAGLALYNPDKPERPVNSPAAVYQIAPEALALLRNYGTSQWAAYLADYQNNRQGLAERYAKARNMNLIPVTLPGGAVLELSAGEHSKLIADIIQDFGARYVPGGQLIYAGDTGQKMGYFNGELLASLGVIVDEHGKMPDAVLYDANRNWLVLVEAVTSHGPMDGKRQGELAKLFGHSTAGLVYVSAFPNRKVMGKYLQDIAWETEVWIADAPDHLMHFNGDRYLGPHA